MIQILLDIVILLVAAVIAVPLFRALNLGVVPGFLVAGVIVGPYGFGLIDNVIEIAHLAELGVVLLLFLIGIELRPARLWRMRRLVFGLGTLQVVVTGCLITAAVYYLLDASFAAAVIIGPALALSSTAFVLQLLAEQKQMNTPYGRASLSVLLLQDLAVVPLLALVPLLAGPRVAVGGDILIALAQAVGILTLAVVAGRYLLQPLLHRIAQTRTREVFSALAVLLVLGAALTTEHIGMSMAMGAFIAGVLIADSPYRHELIAEIQPYRGFLLGLFFMSMGMSLNVGEFLVQPVTILLMLAALFAIKFFVLWGLASLFALTTKTAAAVALLLAQGGEFGLVLFANAFEAKILEPVLYQQLLLVIVISMLVTPPLANLAKKLAQSETVHPPQDAGPEETVPVVLAGFGRVGRTIGRLLSESGKAYVAVDHDSALVLRERASGYPVYYGDACNPEVLRGIGAADAEIVVVTLDDFKATEDVVAALHQADPGAKIIARGHDAEQCRTLRKLGASIAISENLEASIELAREALIHGDGETAEVEAMLNRFRDDYYDKVDSYSSLKAPGSAD